MPLSVLAFLGALRLQCLLLPVLLKMGNYCGIHKKLAFNLNPHTVFCAFQRRNPRVSQTVNSSQTPRPISSAPKKTARLPR